MAEAGCGVVTGRRPTDGHAATIAIGGIRQPRFAQADTRADDAGRIEPSQPTGRPWRVAQLAVWAGEGVGY